MLAGYQQVFVKSVAFQSQPRTNSQPIITNNSEPPRLITKMTPVQSDPQQRVRLLSFFLWGGNAGGNAPPTRPSEFGFLIGGQCGGQRATNPAERVQIQIPSIGGPMRVATRHRPGRAGSDSEYRRLGEQPGNRVPCSCRA